MDVNGMLDLNQSRLNRRQWQSSLGSQESMLSGGKCILDIVCGSRASRQGLSNVSHGLRHSCPYLKLFKRKHWRKLRHQSQCCPACCACVLLLLAFASNPLQPMPKAQRRMGSFSPRCWEQTGQHFSCDKTTARKTWGLENLSGAARLIWILHAP